MIFPAWHDANRLGSTLCNCFRWQIPLRTHMLPGRTGCCVLQKLISRAEGCFQLAVFLRLCACITSIVFEASELARSSFGWWWFIGRRDYAFFKNLAFCSLAGNTRYRKVNEWGQQSDSRGRELRVDIAVFLHTLEWPLDWYIPPASRWTMRRLWQQNFASYEWPMKLLGRELWSLKNSQTLCWIRWPI